MCRDGQGKEKQDDAGRRQVHAAFRIDLCAAHPFSLCGILMEQRAVVALARGGGTKTSRQKGRQKDDRFGVGGAQLMMCAQPVRRFDPYKRETTRITDLCDMFSAATANTIKEAHIL